MADKKQKPASAPAKKTSAGAGSLVIVESPAKQKTIGKILGADFAVRSSFGHVRDLPERELGVDEKNGFAPTYRTLPKAEKNLPDIKRCAAAARDIYLATDPDREGEAIAWHLAQILERETGKMRRISFHEITPSAIKQAINSPRAIDIALVEAQQARRVLDRLVGYKLSPLLWRKIGKGLSAGRVQSVAVRLVAERAAEIAAFKEEAYWSLHALLEKPGAKPEFETRLAQWHGAPVEKTAVHKLFAEDYRVKTTAFDTEQALSGALSALKAGPLTVQNVETKEVRQRPRPPFITSTLQQDASAKLGFSPQRTMMTAQSLYEGVPMEGGETVGLITYMRTDSFNVSRDIQEETRKFIVQAYGDKFLPPRPPLYAGKVKGAQEAHEAIHPTSVFRRPQDMKPFLSGEQFKLYELIWLRFVASQLSDATFEAVSADIAIGAPAAPEGILRATGRTEKFAGYLTVYKEEREDDGEEENTPLPPLQQGDALKLLDAPCRRHQTSPPPAYSEASLIRALERHGIGRPSTYAPTIKTIVDRKYVAKNLKSGRLAPTDLGATVTERLKGYFPELMELSYTADIETKLDDVADGSRKWDAVVNDFYKPFVSDLAKAYKEMAAPQPKETDEKCPLCGEKMLLRESRFGKYLSCSQYPKCKGKARLDSEGKKVTPEATNEVCQKCGKPMVIRTGRRGKFMACSGFPACRNTVSIDAQGNKVAGYSPVTTSHKCPKCSSAMLLRKSARGYFLACSAYPKCRSTAIISEADAKEILEKTAAK
ncbi:MAG: type I DNA topoisomerase [Elusimicrobiales bacterium]